MAHKKAGGSTRLGRDSNAKRLGVKKYGGEVVKSGDIIIRQRGTRYIPGDGVDIGKDHTLFAKKIGVVSYKKKKVVQFTGKLQTRQIVNVNEIVKVNKKPAETDKTEKTSDKTEKKQDNK